MDRFYTDGLRTEPDVLLPETEVHHARNVLRMKVGDRLQVFDGQGAAAEGVLAQLDRRTARVTLEGGWRVDPKPRNRLVIATALPKGDRAKFLVEKATELGVDRLIPLHTTRSVVAPKGAKLDRLRQTVIAACKQCGRNRLLEIDEPRAWAAFLADTPAPLVVAHPGGEANIHPDEGTITVAVGPEGGFTDDELAAADASGAVCVGLAAHVLRIETAVLAAAIRFAGE